MGGFTRIVSSKPMRQHGGVDEYHDPIDVENHRKLSAVNVFLDSKLYKRPGRRLWGPTFADVFDGAHEYIDTDGTSRILVVSGGSVYEVDSSTKTARDTGLTVEDLHFTNHRGRCYYNGASTMRKITSTTAARIGVVAPTGAASGSATSGALTGSYAWKYTFVIEESGAAKWESDPAPAASAVLSSQRYTMTCDASADARVNARYIYRTTAGGALYQYVGKISDNNAATTYEDNALDATLGSALETTHGVPSQTATIAEGCNERMFWADGYKLRWSEPAYTESYLEYQQSTSFKELPRSGVCTGLRRLYNPDTAREDLYVFHADETYLLPGGDPYQPLVTIPGHVGCSQQDTICEYNGSLVYYSANRDKVMLVRGAAQIDLSGRAWPTSIAALLTKSTNRAAIIYDHYYGLTCRNDAGKLYNHQVWVCDLRTVREAQPGMADATWFQWDLNCEYLLATKDGKVLAFDNQAKRIFSLSRTTYDDEAAAGGTYTAIVAEWQTKDFCRSLNTVLCPRMVALKGRMGTGITITPYYGNNYRGSAVNDLTVQTGVAFVAGRSRMGTQITNVPYKIEGAVSSQVAGAWVGFKFTKSDTDTFFEVSEFEYTYNLFERNQI